MNIKQTLIQSGIYSDKLDHQIALATQLKAECQQYRKAIKAEGFTIPGKNGPVANPLIASLQKSESLLQSAYTALGLTYNINPEHIRPKKPKEESKIEDAMDL